MVREWHALFTGLFVISVLYTDFSGVLLFMYPVVYRLFPKL